MTKSLIFFALLVALLTCGQIKSINGLFDFPETRNDLGNIHADLSRVSMQKWYEYISLGTDSFTREERLEANLLRSQITVENGTISHAQLLDSLPNAMARNDSKVAKKILKSSLYFYNNECAGIQIPGEHCAAFLSGKQLPENSELLKECKEILMSRRDGHHPFRRLLPRNYSDGFYEMYFNDKLASPLLISKAFYDWNLNPSNNLVDDSQRSLSLVQWTQFIEHDLSKPVVTSMSNGHPIECCNRNSYKLQPRFHHPACAPLLLKNTKHKRGRETCLNYVRSALAVGTKCTFESVEQLNQATGSLDLSQLYGFTQNTQHLMRTYKNGQIKSTSASKVCHELLPLATDESHTFCAFKLGLNNHMCFQAGDSRVNSNPFAIVIYTIFMRNHNQIANILKTRNPNWNDSEIFALAKSINIDIYRRIVFQEWLPQVLGGEISQKIDKEVLTSGKIDQENNDHQIANEFAVAAIRFYFSMLPNELHNKATNNGNISTQANIFELKDQIYKPVLSYTNQIINEILESLLHQRAMKMDSTYVESLISENWESTRPSHPDMLAFDIQRGRDHGLQGYIKYLEACYDVTINSWKDLEYFLHKESINTLRSVYNDLSDIDLIVGGISEVPASGSTVGPTFTCILAEQFSKIRQWHHISSSPLEKSSEFLRFKTVKAVDVLCANSDLKYVPTNIFKLSSENNPLMSCADRLQPL